MFKAIPNPEPGVHVEMPSLERASSTCAAVTKQNNKYSRCEYDAIRSRLRFLAPCIELMSTSDYNWYKKAVYCDYGMSEIEICEPVACIHL